MKKSRIFAILFSLVLCLSMVSCTLTENHTHDYVNGECACGKREKVAVLIDPQNGEEVETVYVNYTKTLKAPATPYKKGYEFVGWYLGEELYDFESEVVSSFTIVAQWEIVTYHVTYDFGEGPEVAGNPEEFNVNDHVELVKPAKEYYNFLGWFDKTTGVKYDEISGVAQNLALEAKYEAIKYEISYDLQGGENHKDNPQSYTVEDEFVLQEPSQPGYIFLGWVDKDGNEVSEVKLGSHGNIELVAVWEEAPYKLNYELNGGENHKDNPAGYSTEKVQAGLTLEDPTKFGYDFLGWTVDPESDEYFRTLPKDLLGDVTVYANWTPTVYTITYVNVGNPVENKATYTIETESFELAEPTRLGYEFAGWYSGSQKVEKVAKGSTGNIEVEATWEAVEYAIKYNLNGGENNASNPATYTIEEAVALQEPTRIGYEFAGWSNKGKIELGSTGEVEFTASWTPIQYSIEYDLAGGANHKDNPAKYTIEEAVELKEPTRKGFVFAGWSNEGKIELGSTEDKLFVASWTPIQYKITYVLNGGTNNEENPETYTIQQEITLKEPTRLGYTFLGWSNGGKITLGSTDEKAFEAKWQINTYEIKYNLNGGVNGANPATYTVEDSVVLANPTRLGYEFVKWTEGSEIAKGSTGAKTFTAEWKAVEYGITYVLNGGTNGANPSTYTIEDSVVLANPTRLGYTFVKWTEGSEIAKGSTGAKTFTAEWEVVEYEITYVLNGGLLPASYYQTVLNGEATKVINLGIYDNSALKPDIYFCDKVGVTPNNSLRWQYKILLKYDATLGAYEVVAVDAAKATANNAASAAGVEWTHAISSSSIKVNSYATVGQYVVLSKEVAVGDTNFTASVGSKEQVAKVLKEFTYNVEEEFIPAIPTKEHYEFAGWVEGEKVELGSTGAKTFTAQWTPVKYEITYVLNGGTNGANPATYTIEDAVKLVAPTKEHYEFAGWAEGDEIAKGTTGAKTFTAQWTPVEYEITLVLNGGEGQTSVKYTIETETFELPKPSRLNYAFKGWYALEDLSGEEVVSIAKGSTGAKTYYAKWEEAPYQVEYETNGGNSLNPTAFSLATGFPEELPTPTKEGYEFAGWYDNEELSGAKVTEITEYKNYKLYASWTAVQYNIIYNLNGGENNESNPATYTIEDAVKLANPTRLGYEFVGWSNDGEIALGSTGAKEFTAEWRVVEYTITYEVNGGEINYHDLIVAEFLKDFSAFSKTEINHPGAFWSAGSNRVNFFKNEEMHTKWSWMFQYLAAVAKKQGMTTQYIDKLISYPIVESESVYGYQNVPLFLLKINNSLWNASYKATYGGLSSSFTSLDLTVVTFDEYKSYLPEEFNFIYANKYTIENELELSAPERVGYEFLGWYNNAEFAGEGFTKLAKGNAGNISLYAKWSPVEYGITYVLNGGTNGANPATYTIEDAVKLANPTKEHYEFAGWAEGSEIAKGTTGAKTFTAQWTPVEYEITLVLNGGEGATSVKYTIESETFELPKPVKEDYVFKGWYALEDLSGEEVTSIAKGTIGAKTYYAKWEEAPYQVVYNTNGGTYAKESEYFSLATGLPVLENATRAGYEFLGWYDNAELSGEKVEDLSEFKDYQLYAKWGIITYTITYVNDGDKVENPATYTIETETFAIEDASKAGYTFLGWYNGEEVVNEVAKGSIGNLELVAKYEVIEYAITYDLAGGTWSQYATYEERASDLLADYNASSGKSYTKETFFALGSWDEASNAANLLYKSAYRAKWAWLVDYIASVATAANKKAWQNFNKYNSSTELNAANGNYIYEISYEMRAFVAGSKYTKNANFITADYSVESIRSGALAAYKPVNLPTSYTVEESVILPTPNKPGYYFNGWVEAESIELGSTGNKTFTATWTAVEYTVSYDLDGGTNHASNLTKYNIETAEFTLLEPQKDGYEFLGWYNGENKVTSIAGGSIGNLELVAKWADASGISEMEISDADASALNALYTDKTAVPAIIVKSDATDGKYKLVNANLSSNYSTSLYELNTNLFTTITSALAAASEGDVIYVFAGTYSDELTISTANITIAGPNYNVHGKATRAAEANVTGLTTVNGANVAINGLKFSDSGAIKVGASYVTISHIHMTAKQVACNGNNRKGCIVDSADMSNLTVANSYIDAHNNGYNYSYYTNQYMSFTLANNLTITGNYITNSGATTVTGSSNYESMRIYSVKGTLNITNNEFRCATDGYVMYFAAYSSCTGINIKENIFDGNGTVNHTATISFRGCTAPITIEGNKFYNFKGSTFAFTAAATSKVSVSYNYFDAGTAYKIGTAGSTTFTYTNNYYAATQTTATSDYGVITSLDALEAAYKEYKGE